MEKTLSTGAGQLQSDQSIETPSSPPLSYLLYAKVSEDNSMVKRWSTMQP